MLTVLKIVLVVALILFVLYLLAIMPHMTGRPDLKPFSGYYYAHRGLHNNESNAPENSMAAFKKAVDAGFGIELDIHLSKDGIPVVMHDETLIRATGCEGKIGDYTVAELKEKFRLFDSEERIPTFEEVLKLIDGKVPLIVEFKGEDLDVSLCEVAAPMLDAYKGTYCMESFNPLMVRWYKKNRPQIMRGQLSDYFFNDPKYRKASYFILQNLMLNFMAKPDFIAYNHHNMDKLAFSINRSLYGITTFAWTIKSQQELEAAKKKFDFMIFDSFVPER